MPEVVKEVSGLNRPTSISKHGHLNIYIQCYQ